MHRPQENQLMPTARGMRFLPRPVALGFEDTLEADQPLLAALLHLMNQAASDGHATLTLASIQRELGMRPAGEWREILKRRLDNLTRQHYFLTNVAFPLVEYRRFETTRHGPRAIELSLTPDLVSICQNCEHIAYPWKLARDLDPISFNLLTLAIVGQSAVIERPAGIEPAVFKSLMRNTAVTLIENGYISRAKANGDQVRFKAEPANRSAQ